MKYIRYSGPAHGRELARGDGKTRDHPGISKTYLFHEGNGFQLPLNDEADWEIIKDDPEMELVEVMMEEPSQAATIEPAVVDRSQEGGKR